jgi:hypothetical protein
MHASLRITLLLSCPLAVLALPAQAVDRIHTGQWETNSTSGGKTRTHSSCTPQSDVDVMNGDSGAIKALLQSQLPGVCKVTDVQAKGDTVVVTTDCAGSKNTSTTHYHGDSYDSVSSNGTTITAKRVGACK